jgi:hypothetical protein
MRKQTDQKSKRVDKSLPAPPTKNKETSDSMQPVQDETHSVTTSEETEADNQVIAPDGEPELKKEPEPLF